MQLCSSLSILWDCLSLGLEWKLTFSSPVATAEFSSLVFADCNQLLEGAYVPSFWAKPSTLDGEWAWQTRKDSQRLSLGTVNAQAMGTHSLEILAPHQKRSSSDLTSQEVFLVWLYHDGSGSLMEREHLCVHVSQGSITGVPMKKRSQSQHFSDYDPVG